MAEQIGVIIIALIGAGGIWKYIQIAEANRILAKQAKATIAAKDQEIAELEAAVERERDLKIKANARHDKLMDYLTKPQ